MKNYKFWKTLLSQQFKDKIVIAVVTSHTGSSPGKAGFKIIIDQFGNIIGSIGGGRMEREIIDELTSNFDNISSGMRTLVHRKSHKNASGLNCSGEQSILYQKIDSNLITEIIDNYGTDKLIEYNPNGIRLISTREKFSEYFCEKLKYKNNIRIFGGGHVGLAISKVLSNLDFFITIFDNRDIPIVRDNKYCHEKYIGDYKDNMVHLKNGDFIIITTFGYAVDIEVLAYIYHTGIKFRYIGLMGSKAKIAKLLKEAKSRGMSDEFIEFVHAPIGMPISDGSPEEIAISVTAEILKVKNNLK